MILCEAFVIKPPSACTDVVMNHALEDVGHWGLPRNGGVSEIQMNTEMPSEKNFRRHFGGSTVGQTRHTILGLFELVETFTKPHLWYIS